MAGGNRTFVGFGFGPIQAGLFLFEAFRSGNFGRLVVAEVLPEAVSAIRSHGNFYSVNVAHRDHLEKCTVGPIEIYDPAVEGDRSRLIEAVAEAEEMATALPSVRHYASSSPDSVHRIVAEGLCRKAARGGPPAIVYAAENHNRAAELLSECVVQAAPAGRHPVSRCAQFLNTVIGKMSGLVDQPDRSDLPLAPIVPGSRRSFLVESFSRILVSRVDAQAGFSRGIAIFEEKPDLLPFEEAKLFGHNATHALAAYVAAFRGMKRISELASCPNLMRFLRDAFIEESGAALVRKYGGIDPLFTPGGYSHYADDLLERMVNPFLQDTTERVGRDPRRKLGWNDRLAGTIRVGLAAGINPARYALGAAAALACIDEKCPGDPPAAAALLSAIWRPDSPPAGEEAEVLRLIQQEGTRLLEWRRHGFPGLCLTWPQRHSAR